MFLAVPREALLDGGGTADRGGRLVECGEEAVAFVLDLSPSAGVDRLTERAIVPLQQVVPGSVPQRFEEER